MFPTASHIDSLPTLFRLRALNGACAKPVASPDQPQQAVRDPSGLENGSFVGLTTPNPDSSLQSSQSNRLVSESTSSILISAPCVATSDTNPPDLRVDGRHQNPAVPKSSRSRLERRLAKYIRRLNQRHEQSADSPVISPATVETENEPVAQEKHQDNRDALNQIGAESAREPFHDHVGDLIHGLRSWSMKLDLRESDLDRREQELNRRMRLMRQQQSSLE